MSFLEWHDLNSLFYPIVKYNKSLCLTFIVYSIRFRCNYVEVLFLKTDFWANFFLSKYEMKKLKRDQTIKSFCQKLQKMLNKNIWAETALAGRSHPFKD